MNKYDPKKFIKEVSNKIENNKTIRCPYCGGLNFTSTEYIASIIIGQDMSGLSIGPTLPSGMLICENCGHIDFFALGPLGLLNNKAEDGNEQEQNK